MTVAIKQPSVKAWWKEAVCYQIYPSSFNDSNGDGRGDLQGIIAKLDYLKDLGVDVLWLSPIYKGPGVDEGYDISDYRDIDPRFGTLADVDELIDGLHKRGMKLIMDAVLNHSSDQHPWFLESKSSLTNPKRDWYVWEAPRWKKDGKFVEKGTEGAEHYPPNNWESIFYGSAWEWYPETEMYNLHIFAKEQPDLNWECPELRKAIYDDCNWWLARGVDGFRLDAITHISKVHGYPDAPVTIPEDEFQNCFCMFNHGPNAHKFIKEMHREVFSKWDLMTVGEAGGTTPAQAMDYISQDREDKEMCMVFNTDHLDLYGPFDTGIPPEQKLSDMKRVLTMWQTHMIQHGGWNSITGESHDQPRSLIRFGSEDPKYRVQAAKALAMLWLSLSGTPFIYQGQELGMINIPWDWPISEYKDLVSQRHHANQLEARKKNEELPDMTGVMAGLRRKARDNTRTPMPWDATEKAGFTTGEPWMAVNPDNKVANAKDQIGRDGSVLSFYQAMVKVRKENPILVYGDYTIHEFEGLEEEAYAFKRSEDGTTTFTICNLSPNENIIELPFKGSTIISTWGGNGPSEGKMTIGPFEAILYEVLA